jgi:putative Mg2+ transporter-C (MgtC) family protein
VTSLVTELEGLARILLAAVLAAAVGWERESADRPAGLRTHMTMAIAAAMFTTLGAHLAARAAASGDARVDTTRVLEAVVTGVAFLGAGTIFSARHDQQPRGLTTAASLLATAAIGVAVAIGTYALAFGVTILLLVVLRVVRRVEEKAQPQEKAEPQEA